MLGGAEGFRCGSLQTMLTDHGDVMWEGDDDAPICIIPETISNDSVRVSLDLIVIHFALLDTTQIPSDHKGTRARDDGTLLGLSRGKVCRSEGDGTGHVCNMLRLQLQAKGNGLVLAHGFGETK